MTNPYEKLDDNKFWRTAVANKTFDETYSQIWNPKFQISNHTKIIAAGSCFAQHVGHWLSKNDFSYLPSKLDTKHSFSFATGNIYTPALLKQWIAAALGETTLDHIYEEVGDKFIDTLRPSINSEGFDSLNDLLDARKEALDETLSNIKQANLFVFTLGLTETWLHQDGTVYPLCPGTLSGTFDPEKHFFKNYDYNETVKFLDEAFDYIKGINKDIKFLLTVSPVPLTATASQDHVLVATTYSKSVLRCCANSLSETRDDVDYFPSYELISANPSNDSFFEENMRTVTPNGVSYVMRHLQEGLAGEDLKRENQPDKSKTLKAKNNKQTPKTYANEDAVCEEAFLDSMNSSQQKTPHPKYCLLGDSHMWYIANVLKKNRVPFIGGMQQSGASWLNRKFEPDEEDFFILQESQDAQENWQKTIKHLQHLAKNEDIKPVIVTNIGMQIRGTQNAFFWWIDSAESALDFDMPKAIEYIKTFRAKHIATIQNMINAGYKVIFVTDPPLQKFYKMSTSKTERERGPMYEKVAALYEKIYGELVSQMGCKFINIRELMESEAGIKKKYISSEKLEDGNYDWMHGSEKYYKYVTKKILKARPK